MLDIGPKSWITVDGLYTYNILINIINEILKIKNIKKADLCNLVSINLNCSSDLLYDLIRKKTRWIHLNVVNFLLDIIQQEDQKLYYSYKKQFLDSIIWLRSNGGMFPKIKAVKILTEDLARFCGAHAADGTLTLNICIKFPDNDKKRLKKYLIKSFNINLKKRKFNSKGKSLYNYIINLNIKNRYEVLSFLKKHKIKYIISYHITILDGHFTNLLFIKNIFKSLFGMEVKIKKLEDKKAYFISISNKIIGRYLTNIFDFPVGKKSDIVKPPKVIFNSSLEIQRAFCSGLFQFDGSVKYNGNVAFTTISKDLFDFIIKVFRKDGIKNFSIWKNRNDNYIELKYSKHMLKYFIEYTTKYNRLSEFIFGFSRSPKNFNQAIYYLSSAFPKNTNSKMNIKNIFMEIKNAQEIERYFLVNKLKLNYKNLENPIKILLRGNLIKIKKIRMEERFLGLRDKLIYNENVMEWRIPKSF